MTPAPNTRCQCGLPFRDHITVVIHAGTVHHYCAEFKPRVEEISADDVRSCMPDALFASKPDGE